MSVLTCWDVYDKPLSTQGEANSLKQNGTTSTSELTSYSEGKNKGGISIAFPNALLQSLEEIGNDSLLNIIRVDSLDADVALSILLTKSREDWRATREALLSRLN